MKKIGIIRALTEDKQMSKEQMLFKEYLAKIDVSPVFFAWNSIKKNIAENSFSEKEDEKIIDLNSLPIIYLSSLGSIENGERKLCKTFEELDCLESIVINDPKTMIKNFDKGYLLYLQEKGVSVIPTKQVQSLDEIEEFKKSSKYEDLVLKPRLFGERMRNVVRLSEIKTEEEFNEYFAAVKEQGLFAQQFVPDIIKYGERSLIFVGDSFSHCIYRRRTGWKENQRPVGELSVCYKVEPTKNELKVAEDVLSVWPDKYHITRFDFITNQDKPMISEVEMINPNLWLAREGIAEAFMPLFINYVKKQL